LVEAALEEARRTRPEVPVRILTNGSRAIFPEVRRAPDRLDERIIKLEADPERMSGVRVAYGAILFGLALLRDVTLHSCFVEGWLSNTGEGCVEDWIELVAEIRPRSGQVHTIDRKPVQAHVWPVPASRLAGIAVRLRGRTGIDAVAPRPGGPPVAGRRSRRPRGQRLRGPGPGARPM
jgi:hypothetical protein